MLWSAAFSLDWSNLWFPFILICYVRSMRREPILLLQSQETCCTGTWRRGRWFQLLQQLDVLSTSHLPRWSTRRSKRTSSRSSTTRTSRAVSSSARGEARATSLGSACPGFQEKFKLDGNGKVVVQGLCPREPNNGSSSFHSLHSSRLVRHQSVPS